MYWVAHPSSNTWIIIALSTSSSMRSQLNTNWHSVKSLFFSRLIYLVRCFELNKFQCTLVGFHCSFSQNRSDFKKKSTQHDWKRSVFSHLRVFFFFFKMIVFPLLVFLGSNFKLCINKQVNGNPPSHWLDVRKREL